MRLLFSLKRALTVNFLLVASVPVLIFGLLNIQLITKQQLEGVRERNMLLARNIAGEVESFLVEVHSDLNQIEQTIASEIIQHPADIDRFLASVVGNSQFFESVYLLDKNHKITHLGVLPILQSRLDDYAGLDFSGHYLFQSGSEIKKPTWSNTFISLVTGEPSVTLGLPSKQGFLLGNIRLSSLGIFLHRFSSHVGLEISIIDESGTVIAHNVDETATQRINLSDHPAVVQALQGTDSTHEFRQGSKHYLESVARISSSAWAVWVGLDMNEVQAPIHNMRNLLIGFMVASLILGCLIALLNVRRLMKPLNDLGMKTGQIADGNYEFNFSPSGFSEIDALANQFENMTRAIRVREQSIITNEQRFRDLVNSIDGVVWEMEYPSFRFLFVSRQAATILGYPVEDWYNEPSFWEDKTHNEDLAEAKAYCQMMSERHIDHDFEYRMIAANGRVIWIRDLVTVVVENDRPVRLLGVMIDITSQKKLLEELSRSEQNYREIFNSTSDAIFIHDAETGQIVDVNQSMMNIFNCSYEKAISSDIEAFNLGESPYSSKEASLKLLEAKETGHCTFEWRSRKATGELFWCEVYLRSAMIGNKPRILAAVRDISDRKDAAEKLREANERLLLLIDRMPLGCILWTPAFKVAMWNPAAEAIFGFSEEHMIGHDPYGEIFSAEARLYLEPLWARMVAGDKTVQSLNDNVTKDGRTITCEWYNTPMSDNSGSIIGVISMVQDVSDRKAAENELEIYRAHLEELIMERTEQLQAAQQELIQKDRLAVLGQLTATVSHEIRNPLGTVANSLYLLKDLLSGEQHEHLARPLKLAERNVERCDNIISELLDFSRQRKIQKEPLNIDEWLSELLSELSFPAEVQRHQELTSRTIVPADSERLRRAMVNVITNALQALDECSGTDRTLNILTRIVDNRCEIQVRDNGPGMSEEVMARIFEPMFSTKNFGVGLGVPIIMNILEDHGGGVVYRSEVGKGTTVTMWLPLREESQLGEENLLN